MGVSKPCRYICTKQIGWGYEENNFLDKGFVAQNALERLAHGVAPRVAPLDYLGRLGVISWRQL
ncbi:MAG: hypothetical protein HKL81_06725 [Acidimicrobiaceae bacterium]|nr:hypothetical protein [Acidimicrobiaceae bacterium]